MPRSGVLGLIEWIPSELPTSRTAQAPGHDETSGLQIRLVPARVSGYHCTFFSGLQRPLGATQILRVARSPCDETSQTGASLSSSDFPAPSSTPTDRPRSHTPRLRSTAERKEDGALEKTARAAEETIETEERGKQAGSQVTHVCSSRNIFMQKKRQTSEELRQRFYDSTCHSFPTYGTSKDGVPLPDPMNSRTKLALTGGKPPAFNNLSKDSSKRSIAEAPRVAKRQKVQPETTLRDVPPHATLTTQTFAPPVASSSLSPQTPALVDLTHSQRSVDGDAASNRSTHSVNSTASGSEFRNVEKAHSGSSRGGRRSGNRPRPRGLRVRDSKKPEGYDWDGEDEIVQDQPTQNRRARGDSAEAPRKKAFRQPPRRGQDDIQEVSEDDELAFQTGRSRRAGDDISDDDGRSPDAGNTKRKRGDMTTVKFEKSQPVKSQPVISQPVISQPVISQPVISQQGIPKNFTLKVVRAVSGKDTFEAKKPEECVLLKLDQHFRSLIAFDQAGRPFSERGWLDVKLMFCTKIFYSITGTPFAVIWRSSSSNVGGLLVLGFAEPGDAHRLGDWAEARVKAFTTQKTDCSPKDSEYLQKIYEKQKAIAEKWEDKRDSQPDDIKLLEHKEAIKAKADTVSVPWTQSKTSPPSNPPLRGSMKAEDSSRSSKPEITPSRSSKPDTTTSSYFAPISHDTGTESRQAKESPREARSTARRVQESSLGMPKRKSPSPVSWIQQNPDWDKIWNEKPLIFPATGKNRASVYRDDISRLEEGEYLNDNLIGFYLRYLQVHLEKQNKKLSDRIYIMNTYFYPKLTDTKAGRGINYEGVKSWTAKVDLFAYDYIVVPVNESAHWYLAIICHPSKLLKTDDGEPEVKDGKSLDEFKEELKGTPEEKPVRSDEGMVSTVGEQVELMSLEESQPGEEEKKEEPRPGKKDKGPSTKQRQVRKSTGIAFRKQDPTEARVITLDSLGVGHSPTCGNLKAYLVQEAKDKRNMAIEPPGTFGLTAKKIPEQEDHASCGAFLLGYMREFLKDPDSVVTKIVRKERLDWDITSPAMRSELRTIIIEQRKLQNATLAAERKAKRMSTGQPTPGILPDERQESELAPPRTPQPVADVPKNPSSTVKGSPAIGLPPNNGISPPAKIEGGDATSLSEDPDSSKQGKFTITGIEEVSGIAQPVGVKEGPRMEKTPQVEPNAQHIEACEPGPAAERSVLPGNTILPTNEQCDVMRTLVDSFEPPATPIREASRSGNSTGGRFRTSPRRTSPRFSRTKPVEVDENQMLSALKSTPAQPSDQVVPGSRSSKKKPGNSHKMLQPLASSPAQSAEQRKAAVRGFKRKLSISEEILCKLSSPPPKAARKDEKPESQPQKGDSPSQQLLGELQSSGESMPGQRLTSGTDARMQESIIIEDAEAPKTSPRTLTNTITQKSSYSEVKSPPRSTKKRKQPSPQDQRARNRAIPSIERDAESSFNKIQRPANGSETVDLTVN
ncbi:sentrin-specific protease [Colletotrichum abscissum]|uniref:Sentrin-specific protease n=1 Tax=Colletotrichum abscissum TaxID=1671311 RepID=A0A9Q0AZR9_9PEZI|nr:sentrin-specific protease [Colletotrichum abscissum]KAI3535489.1 sentrin-specific protease [Colletotrichum abscissum]KAK1505044.1 sentrin-specific protease [Colletotrichum abscissum]